MRKYGRRGLCGCLALMLVLALAGCSGSPAEESASDTTGENGSAAEETLEDSGDISETETGGAGDEEDAAGEEGAEEEDEGPLIALEPGLILKEYDASDEEALLWDSDVLTVNLVQIYTDAENNLCILMDMENHTNEDMTVYAENVAVNQTMLSGMFTDDVVPADAGAEMTLVVENLEDSHIDHIGDIRLAFSGYGSASLDGQVETDRLRIVLDGAHAVPAMPEGGDFIYEDDSIQVTVYSREEDDEYLYLPVCVANISDTPFYIECDTVECGETEMNAGFYEGIYDGCVLFANIRLEKEALESAGVAEPGDVVTQFAVVDLDTLEDIYTTEDITLPD